MGKFDNILIVTDLDGTFLGENGTLVDRNLEAVEYFKNNGGYFTFATGRMHKNLLDAIPEPSKIINAPTIMANGTYLYEYSNDSAYYEKFIDGKKLCAVLEFVRDKYPDVCIILSCKKGLVVYTIDGYARLDLEKAYQRGDLIITSFDEMKMMEDCYKVVFRAKPETLDEMRANFAVELIGDLTCSKSYPDFFEIQSGGCDKARGVAVLREMLEKKHGKIKIYACGDYENDEAMLKAADIAVCPLNATDSIKSISDYCLCKNTEGLIADLIKLIESMT